MILFSFWSEYTFILYTNVISFAFANEMETMSIVIPQGSEITPSNLFHGTTTDLNQSVDTVNYSYNSDLSTTIENLELTANIAESIIGGKEYVKNNLAGKNSYPLQWNQNYWVQISSNMVNLI